MEKKCPKCKQSKGIINFRRDETTKSKLHSVCRDCELEAGREYYKRTRKERVKSSLRWKANNRERFNEYMATRRQRIKKEVMEGYGGRCTCCGEAELSFLTIEHKNKDGIEHRKRKRGDSLGIYRDIIKAGFPSCYTVLCMNCNFAIRYGKTCPHKLAELE